jgi:predicted TIM-barrel fold metal-dependent hydrolase
MIVDVHTHTPRYRTRDAVPDLPVNAKWRPDKPMPTGYTWDDFLTVTAPVDRAICFNIAADPRPHMPDGLSPQTRASARQLNDETAAFVNAHADKFIGFLAMHPHEPEMLAEIDRATQDLGLKGIKLGPNYQNFDPVGPESYRLYRRAEQLRLPVLFHQGTSPERFADLDYAHPRHMDRIATAFPNLTVIMAHMAHPWQIDCFTVIRKHPNIWADISANFYRPWSQYNALRAATEWGVLDKLLFGSDFPAATPQETMDGLRRVNAILDGTALPRVPEKKIEELINRDSLSLLGLD